MTDPLGSVRMDWQSAALQIGEQLAANGPTGYYSFTPDEWRDWALKQIATRATVPPASAAWQDVEQVLQQEGGLHVLKILIADARAADAQQQAELKKELALADEEIAHLGVLLRAEQREVAASRKDWEEQAQQIAHWQRVAEMCGADADRWIQKVIAGKQQIAALRAEVEHQKVEVTRAVLRYTVKGYTAGENADSKHWRERAEAAEAQLTALQAEQAQWQQKVTEICQSLDRINIHDHIDTSMEINYVREALEQLAALTAQPDGSLPTRQPKP